MSKTIEVQANVTSEAATRAACRVLGLTEPRHETAQIYGRKYTGLAVNLRNWRYPVVVDLATGKLQYDNFEGAWGDGARLDEFLQRYGVEAVKIAALDRGETIEEVARADGSILIRVHALQGV